MNTKIMRAGNMGDDPFRKANLLMIKVRGEKDGMHPPDTEEGDLVPCRSLLLASLPINPEKIQGLVDFITVSVVENILITNGLLAIR